LELQQIGVIHSPYGTQDEAPRQGRLAGEISELEISPRFASGLKDIDLTSHLMVLYWCHRADRERLQTVTPFGPEVRGVFACRSPARPNPIAVCMVELLQVKGNRLLVRGLDALDGSPLLDIKPYSPALDSIPDARRTREREGE
jgi:tRNA-Thr(GGU) m(6)t(6)A37 methyltransferase TsaA